MGWCAHALWDALGKECCWWHCPVIGCQWPQLGLDWPGDICPSSQSYKVLQTPPSLPGTPPQMPMDHAHLCVLLSRGFPGQGRAEAGTKCLSCS